MGSPGLVGNLRQEYEAEGGTGPGFLVAMGQPDGHFPLQVVSSGHLTRHVQQPYGDEYREVSVGELVHVPSGLFHGIENIGDTTPTFVSAAPPAFDYREAYDRGQLVSDAYEKSVIGQENCSRPRAAVPLIILESLRDVMQARAKLLS